MITSRSRILDAAELIVLRDGVTRLTLDAVAAETHLSKGGVLYHFPSKDDLVAGMIARLSDQFEEQVARAEREDPCPVGRKLRAILRVSFPKEPGEAACRADRVAAGLLAAVVKNRSLLNPIRERAQARHAYLIQEGLDPVTASVIELAADGLWLGGMFGCTTLDPALREQVVGRLVEMTKGALC